MAECANRSIGGAGIASANIILSTHSRRLVFIDFGSAWTAERTAFRCDGDGSRPVYAAPEYAVDSIAVDFRADYFSLAAVGYEILTQQVPYDGLGGRAGSPMYREQSDSLYVPPSQLSREAATIDSRAWTAIDALLCTALQIDRDKRFATGQEWLDAWQSVHDIFQQPAKRSWIDRLLFRFGALFDRTPPCKCPPNSATSEFLISGMRGLPTESIAAVTTKLVPLVISQHDDRKQNSQTLDAATVANRVWLTERAQAAGLWAV